MADVCNQECKDRARTQLGSCININRCCRSVFFFLDHIFPMERITESYAESMRQLGARRDTGQQHWEAGMSFLVAGNIFYFATLVVLRAFMQRRPAYNPNLLMRLYNVRYAGAGAPVRIMYLVTRRLQHVF